MYIYIYIYIYIYTYIYIYIYMYITEDFIKNYDEENGVESYLKS